MAALRGGEEILVGFPRRSFGGSELLLLSCRTFEFNIIDAALVEGGIGMVCACGECEGEAWEAIEVVMVIMTFDGNPTFSSRSLSTGEIILMFVDGVLELVYENKIDGATHPSKDDRGGQQ